MDPIGFTMGVIPLIVLTLQGYKLVYNFASEYNSFNRKLRSVLTRVSIAGSLFKHIVNILLAEVIDEDTRDEILENLNSEKWEPYGTDENIFCNLRDLFLPVMDSIRGAQETLQDIRKLLLVLSGNVVQPSKEKLPFKHLTLGVAAIATSILRTDPLKLHFKNIQVQSISKKLLSLAKNHQGELETLLSRLNDHNRSLETCIRLTRRHKSAAWINGTAKPLLPRSSSFLMVTGHTGEATKGLVDLKAMQEESRRLYRLVSQTLVCECHLIHLCLDRRAEGENTIESSNEKLKQTPPAKPETKFSFQLTVKPDVSKKRSSNISHSSIQLIFTSRERKDNDPLPHDNRANLGICQEISSSDEKYEKYLHSSSEPGKSGFALRRVCTPKMATRGASRCAPALSLEDLVTSRPAELGPFDRFLIAANLAHSLVDFYSSPWVRDWSLQTIHFFENQEQPTSTPGLWAPHLSITFNSRDLRQFGARNREIHSLGLILLQLGCKTPLKPSQDDSEELVLEKAFGNLHREMGVRYMKFVRNCLASWSDRSMDLMKDDNLSVFLSHVSELEKAAEDFDSR